MAVRSLTESYLFLRNNFIRNNYFQYENEDTRSLVSKNKNQDVEDPLLKNYRNEWQSYVNSLQFTYNMIKQKMKDVISLHDRHLITSSIDDIDDGSEIELQTKELSELFNLSRNQLNKLSKYTRSHKWESADESKLSQNVVSNLAKTLQDLSVSFKKEQSEYLNKLRSRDERISGYLTFDLNFEDDKTLGVNEYENESYAVLEIQKQKRRSLIDQNSELVMQREHEINQIVRSIYELNEIFRDVAQMVIDQGSLVDRIDYNVENTQIRIQKGLKELTSAQACQSKDRKMIVIMTLAGLIILFGTILLLTKFRF